MMSSSHLDPALSPTAYRTTKQYPIISPIEREKQRMQVQLDKIKKIILSNPYKYSNYMEYNSALVPEKLINRNIVDPTPVFEDEEDNAALY